MFGRIDVSKRSRYLNVHVICNNVMKLGKERTIDRKFLDTRYHRGYVQTKL